jgi:large subunit ribosomal protein L21
MVVGGVLAWLYQHYFWSRPKTLPAAPPQPAQPPQRVQSPDDLVALRGIGPAFALRLQQAGIRTYADLAGLTPEKVAELCQVPAWRIRRDNWIGQAAARVR